MTKRSGAVQCCLAVLVSSVDGSTVLNEQSFNTLNAIECGRQLQRCAAIFDVLKDEYLHCPSTPDEWLAVAEEFKSTWNFPNCVGAIDGKHIVMRKPHHAGSLFHNYKGQESLVLMAVADAQQK